MQLTMEETAKTPKANNKKTPKKSDAKKTPLKKDEALTPKTTPKTPESNSQKKKKNAANKKLKLNNNESKKITNEKNVQTEVTVRVSLPINKPIPPKVLLEMFEECQHAEFKYQPKGGLAVFIEYNPSITSRKVEELKKAKIEGSGLRVNENIRTFSSLKRTLYLQNVADQEVVKKFYNPKSIERFKNVKGKETRLYVLTFGTEEEAEAASQKKLDLGGKSLSLNPFYNIGNAENKEVKNEKPAEKQTPSQKKPSKNVQVKRKAEEEEEESDDDEEEKEEFDLDDINMDDDDDDEEEDEDDEE